MRPKVERIELLYQHGGSDKFWVAFISGGDAIAWWGRRGARGQSQMISAGEARDRIYSKVAKGYVRRRDQAISNYQGEWNVTALQHAFLSASRTAQRSEEVPSIFSW